MKNKSGKLITESISWKEITPGGMIFDSGNSVHFKTGDWRSQTPEYIKAKCKQCLLCVPVCPDSSIPVEKSMRGEFDLDHCKGCGICYKVCPFKAIEFSNEEK